MVKKTSPSVTIAIPAFNEQETIEKVVGQVKKVLSSITNNYEILLVNDGSTDKTAQILDKLKKNNRSIKVIHHKKNKGFTGAISSALFNAKKDLVLLAPADGQFDFKEVKKFIKAMENYDAAVGYRIFNEENFLRKLNSKLFHFLCLILFQIKLKEISTISIWRKSLLQSIKIDSHHRSALILPELIHKSLKKGYRFNEVPINWYLRQGGQAKGAGVKTIYKTLLEMYRLWHKISFKN